MERYLPPPTITDLTISGSISGSTTSSFANVAILRFEGGTHLISSSLEPNAMIVDLSGISNSGSWDGTFTGSAEISGSLNVIGDISAFTYYGDGSNLTGIDSGSWNGIFTGSAEITGSLNVIGPFTASGLNYPDTDGIDRQVIKTDGNGNLTFGYAENVEISVKNVSGNTIFKGTPCYVTGSGTSGNIAGIVPADAGNPALMPAGIIAGEDILDEEEGVGLVNGFIQNVDTSLFTSGDTVYVAVGGGYTNIKPTGSLALIQKLGNVEKVGKNGSGLINGPNYYNDLPNWEEGKIMVGTTTYPSTSSIVTLNETTKKLTIEGSGSTVFEVIGSEGQLFSITDSLSGSLFAVSDVSGLPILEVFSDDRIVAGAFNNEALVISGSHTTLKDTVISGSLEVSSSISALTYYGDGSNLTGINSGSWNGIFTGSAEISGSLTLEGNISASNEITATIFTATGRLTATNITASIISASGNIITNTLTASSALIENTLQFYTQSVVPTAVAGTLYLDSNYDLHLAQ